MQTELYNIIPMKKMTIIIIKLESDYVYLISDGSDYTVHPFRTLWYNTVIFNTGMLSKH